MLQGCLNEHDVLILLEGHWQSMGGEARMVAEDWMVSSENQWNGKGIEMKAGDTLFQEKLTILETDSGWYYRAHPQMAKNPTYFLIEEWSHQGFKAVNRKNDYPQEISYKMSRDTLFILLKGHPNFETEWSETFILIR